MQREIQLFLYRYRLVKKRQICFIAKISLRLFFIRGLKYPKLVCTGQTFLDFLLKGPALVSRYLLIFYRVKARNSSNIIRVLRYKGRGREVLQEIVRSRKRGRKEKRVKEKTLPMAITSISALKTIYYHQLKIPAPSKGRQSQPYLGSCSNSTCFYQKHPPIYLLVLYTTSQEKRTISTPLVLSTISYKSKPLDQF